VYAAVSSSAKVEEDFLAAKKLANNKTTKGKNQRASSKQVSPASQGMGIR
jgi:hypothetical protein